MPAMAIFSRKSKAKKEEEKKDQKEVTEEKPKVAYKHVPTHAALDSAGQGGRAESTQDRHQIALASRRRIANSMYDSTLSNAAFAQEIAHNMAHGTPSPSALTPGDARFLNHMQRNYSEEAFMGADGRSIAGSSVQRSQSATAPRSRMVRDSSSDYFYNSRTQIPFDSSSISNGKRPANNIGSSCGTPHYSSDSGYESAGPPSALHSRAPSEQNFEECAKGYSSANNSGYLLPELTLSEEHMTRPSASEKTPEGGPKASGHVAPLDIHADSRSVGSHRSSGSISKKARFEDDPEQQQNENDRSTTSTPRLPEAPESIEEVLSERLAVAVPIESGAAVQIHEPKPRALRPILANKLSPPQSHVAPQRAASTPSDSPPLLSVLEGLRVNKKGKILDEEGDVIGELVQGDLLDCVRQKANANGEVLDENGQVVGLVRTVPRTVAIAQEEELARGRRPSLPQIHIASENQPQTSSLKQEELTSAVQTHQTRDLAESQSAKRPVRNSSERSLSELSKPYARPAMSSVPENNVPDDDVVPESPAVFGYKGEIPMFDGPQSPVRMRSKSPASIPYLRPSLPAGHANSMLFTPMRPVAGMNPRRATTQYTGGVSPVRHPAYNAVRRSHFSGFEMSPNNSETGTDASNSDDGRMPTIGGHTRSSSIRTTGTATASRPRTYFTHAGRVTVDPNAPKPKKTEETKQAAPVQEKKPEPKKKSRMSLSFGKKTKAAA